MGMKVLVTGAGSGVGQSVIKSLRMAQELDVEIIGMDASPLNVGVYSCDKGYLGLRADNPQYVEQLLKIVEEERVQALFVGTDTELPIISEIRNMILDLGCFPMVGSHMSSRIARNKLECADFFHRHGFPFAKTAYLEDANAFVEEVGFPVILKPIDGSGSVGVHAVLSHAELNSFKESESGYGTIVQEFLVPQSWGKSRHDVTARDVFINGALNQVDEISIQVLVGESCTLGCFISRNQLKAGYPMKIIPVRDDSLESLSIQIAEAFRKTGLIGPLNLQCRMTESGPVFFEVNPRFTGITGMRAGMGFNECVGLLRHFVLHEDANLIQDYLSFTDEWVCARYMTEVLIPKHALNELTTTGMTLARGRSLSL